MNLWHEIDPGEKSAMNVVVEINKGSRNKYEVDKKTGLIALDRVLYSTQEYPFDYGFVPQSLWHDGDPLDVVLLTTQPIAPGILVKARPVALLHMTDAGEADEKIIAVPVDDPRFANMKDKADINPHTLKEISHFFATYKQLQNKEVIVGEIEGKSAAEEAFAEGLRLYREKYPKA